MIKGACISTSMDVFWLVCVARQDQRRRKAVATPSTGSTALVSGDRIAARRRHLGCSRSTAFFVSNRELVPCARVSRRKQQRPHTAEQGESTTKSQKATTSTNPDSRHMAPLTDHNPIVLVGLHDKNPTTSKTPVRVTRCEVIASTGDHEIQCSRGTAIRELS